MTRKVTKVLCEIVAAELNDDGRTVADGPVARNGKGTFAIYYPFGEKLDELITEIEGDLNAEKGTQDL